jgi:AhpD family alkylhydroperoxidase
MIEPRLKEIYAQFYKETYFTDKKALDSKTQELIALACSLVAKCDGCIEGHIKKALKFGATKEEISEAIVIAIGINAAAIVDMTDRAAAKMGLNHFPAKPSRKP